MANSKTSGSVRQRGVVLMGLLVLLILATGTAFLYRSNQSAAGAMHREAMTMTALIQARDALVSRAVADANRPGSLPCPDRITNNVLLNNVPGDGKADLLVGNVCPTYVGWLPWRTLGLPDLRDGSGERLWYVLSPDFRDSDTSEINPTTPTTLTLDGRSGVVALLIAPGAALNNQTRPNHDPANYLDNYDEGDNYFSGPLNSTFNDRIIALDTTTLFNLVAQRILGEIRYAVTQSGTALPFADTNDDGLADTSAIGRFPYLDDAYKDIESASWRIATPASPPPPPPQKKWFESLESNKWFPLVEYDQSSRTITLYSRSLVLP